MPLVVVDRLVELSREQGVADRDDRYERNAGDQHEPHGTRTPPHCGLPTVSNWDSKMPPAVHRGHLVRFAMLLLRGIDADVAEAVWLAAVGVERCRQTTVRTDTRRIRVQDAVVRSTLDDDPT